MPDSINRFFFSFNSISFSSLPYWFICYIYCLVYFLLCLYVFIFLQAFILFFTFLSLIIFYLLLLYGCLFVTASGCECDWFPSCRWMFARCRNCACTFWLFQLCFVAFFVLVFFSWILLLRNKSFMHATQITQEN